MLTRALGTRSLVRDLGRWREDTGRRPTYRALADGIRLLVHDGRVPLGVALPSERELAAALEVSRTTITSAYTVLRDEGYLVTRQGARSVVAMPATGTPRGGALAYLPVPDGGAVDLSYAAMTAPVDDVHAAYADALDQLQRFLPTHGMEPLGVDVLRAQVAQRYTARGLPTDPDQIMITSGAQHALRLLLGALAAPGERVLVDHPTYPNALEAIRHVGARAVPVPVRHEYGTADAWDLDAIRTAARQTAARMAYLVPDFHNPTGMCLDAAGRQRLSDIAHETRMTLVVDETMVDLWLDAPSPGPVAAFARDTARADVVTVGSAAKSFWGGLRVGWIRADPALVSRLAGARAAVDLGTAVIDQLAAARLLADDSALLDARRASLRSRRAALVDAVRTYLPDWTFTVGPGGLALWLRMPAPVSTALAATAPAHGVVLAAGPRFGVEGAFERFLRIPFARPESDLRTGVERIAHAYAALAGATGREPELVV